MLKAGRPNPRSDCPDRDTRTAVHESNRSRRRVHRGSIDTIPSRQRLTANGRSIHEWNREPCDAGRHSRMCTPREKEKGDQGHSTKQLMQGNRLIHICLSRPLLSICERNLVAAPPSAQDDRWIARIVRMGDRRSSPIFPTAGEYRSDNPADPPVILRRRRSDFKLSRAPASGRTACAHGVAIPRTSLSAGSPAHPGIVIDPVIGKKPACTDAPQAS